MKTIKFNNQTYQLNAEETILSCLLRHGVDYPHSCQSGICQACLTKSPTKTTINPAWQEGLPEILKSQGYFLACLAKPTIDVQVALPNTAECEVTATIKSISALNHNVIKLELMTDDLEVWTPGQYVNLINPNNISRSYSIANIPVQDGYIELHVKCVTNGAMSEWLQNEN